MSVVPVTVTKCGSKYECGDGCRDGQRHGQRHQVCGSKHEHIKWPQNIWAMREQASMSTLISNLKVNDESLWGYVKPMPPPPALASLTRLAGNPGRRHRRGQGRIREAYSPRRRCVVPIPIKASSRVEIDDTVEESRKHHSTCMALPVRMACNPELIKGECLVTKDERKKQRARQTGPAGR